MTPMLLQLITHRNSIFAMYAWRQLDRKATASLLARVAAPHPTLSRWLGYLRLRAERYWSSRS
jgi:hypothetical protein